MLVAVGLVTLPKTICLVAPLEVDEAPEAVPLRLPDVALLTLQEPDKSVESRVEEVVTRPVGALQLPEAASQISASNDWKVAVVAVSKSKV